MALDAQCGGRGAWLAGIPGGLIYSSRCWARAGCKQISQDRCGNHLVPDKPSRVVTTRDTPPRIFFFWVVTDVYPPVCNGAAWTMPPVNRREQCPWHTRRCSGYVLTATLIASLRLTTPAPLVLITIIITLTLRTGFPPAPSHSTRMCFVLLTQMLGAGTPAHDFVTPLTFSHCGCHTTRSSFAFLSFLSFLLFQLVTRCSKSETQTTQQLCWLPSRGGKKQKKNRAGSGSDRGRPDVFLWTATWKFDRKLRLCLAAVCSCWRDEIIQAASPLPLSPSLFCPGVSREGLAGGKANVAVATVLTCSE